MADLDWKRICTRAAGACTEGAVRGRLVFYVLSGKRAEIKSSVQSERVRGYVEALAPLKKDMEVASILEDGAFYALVRLCEKKPECHRAIRLAAAKGCRELAKNGVTAIEVGDDFRPEVVVEAAILSTYNYDLIHSTKKDPVQIVYSGADERVRSSIAISEAQNFARFLADTPANLMTPEKFCLYARQYLPDNVEVNERRRDFMKEKGMNLLLGVANGSEEEPRLLEVIYRGKGGDTDMAFVGKGITFDSGGISIKPAAKMSLMKGDMLGGAAVVSSIGAVARLKAQVNLVAIVPLTENLPSGRATKPGDVHVGCAGKSVEVDNTDAEGRLVLADGLAYALSFSPRAVIDVATLTGAMNVALGEVYAGLFSNDEKLAAELVEVGERTGDLVWRMPCTDDYKPLISSDVADLKNTGGPAAGSVTAALFLREFVGGAKWAHIDIAGAMTNTLVPELHGKGMSGRPVRLLSELALGQPQF